MIRTNKTFYQNFISQLTKYFNRILFPKVLNVQVESYVLPNNNMDELSTRVIIIGSTKTWSMHLFFSQPLSLPFPKYPLVL